MAVDQATKKQPQQFLIPSAQLTQEKYEEAEDAMERAAEKFDSKLDDHWRFMSPTEVEDEAYKRTNEWRLKMFGNGPVGHTPDISPAEKERRTKAKYRNLLSRVKMEGWNERGTTEKQVMRAIRNGVLMTPTNMQLTAGQLKNFADSSNKGFLKPWYMTEEQALQTVQFKGGLSEKDMVALSKTHPDDVLKSPEVSPRAKKMFSRELHMRRLGPPLAAGNLEASTIWQRAASTLVGFVVNWADWGSAADAQVLDKMATIMEANERKKGLPGKIEEVLEYKTIPEHKVHLLNTWHTVPEEVIPVSPKDRWGGVTEEEWKDYLKTELKRTGASEYKQKLMEKAYTKVGPYARFGGEAAGVGIAKVMNTFMHDVGAQTTSLDAKIPDQVDQLFRIRGYYVRTAKKLLPQHILKKYTEEEFIKLKHDDPDWYDSELTKLAYDLCMADGVGGLNDPGSRKLASQVFFDPTMWFGSIMYKGPYRALKGGLKSITDMKILEKMGAKKVWDNLGGQAVHSVVIGLRDLFVHHLDTNVHLKSLEDVGKKVGDVLYAAEGKGAAVTTQARKYHRLMYKTLSVAKSKSDKVLLARIMDTPKEARSELMMSAPHHIRKAAIDATTLGDEIFWWLKQHNLMKHVRKGSIVDTKMVNGYMPHLLFEGMEDLTDRLRSVGFDGIEDAIAQLAHPNSSKLAMEAMKRMPEKSQQQLHRIWKQARRTDTMGYSRVSRRPTQMRMAQERIGGDPLMDAQLQWNEYFKELSSRISHVEQLNVISRALGVSGDIANLFNKGSLLAKSSESKIRASIMNSRAKGFKYGSAGDDPLKVSADEISDHIQATEDLMGAATGMQFGHLKDELAQTWLKATGKVSKGLKPTKIDRDAVVFLPQFMVEHIDRMTRISPGPLWAKGAVHNLSKFNHWLLQPTNNIIRRGMTMTRAAAFYGVNTVGAIGLAGVSLGLKALNPKLQLRATAGAISAAFMGGKKFRGMAWKLEDGSQYTIGQALDVLKDHGYLQSYREKLGLATTIGQKGPFVAAERLQARITEVTHLDNIAAVGDDYQKVISFMGKLKGSSRADVLDALAFVRKETATYQHMTHFERSVMKDVFLFYGWARYILPFLGRHIRDNPQRLAAFEKLKLMYEEKLGDDRRMMPQAIPQYLKLQGAVTAPKGWQPQANDMATPLNHGQAMTVLETPLASFGMFAGGFRGESPVAQAMTPSALAFLTMITGVDMLGMIPYKKIPLAPSVPDLGQFESSDDVRNWLYSAEPSLAGKALGVYVPFGNNILDMAKLYSDHGDYNNAFLMSLKYRVGRDTMGLDRLAAKATGAVSMMFGGEDVQPRSIGSFPGARTYWVEQLSNLRNMQREAVRMGPGKYRLPSSDVDDEFTDWEDDHELNRARDLGIDDTGETEPDTPMELHIEGTEHGLDDDLTSEYNRIHGIVNNK